MSQTRRFIVSGRVQGVFFRDSARQVATELKITGHAINRRDGSVEVLACGEPEALDQLAQWLKRGPPLAAVTDVAVEATADTDLQGFRIG